MESDSKSRTYRAVDTSYRIDGTRRDGLINVAWGARLNDTIDDARQRRYADNQLNLEPDSACAGCSLIAVVSILDTGLI